MRLTLIAAVIGVTTVTALPTSSVSARTLTAAEATALALEFNRTYLAAQEDERAAGADVTKARAGAFPDITLTGTYNRNFDIPSFFVTATDEAGETEAIEFKTGFKNSYGANLSIVQSIWQGGKVFTALSVAKDYRKFAGSVSSQVEASIIYQSEVLFYGVALEQSRLDVLNKSHEAAAHNLEVVEKQFAQGQVSEFEVLRARVEKLNLEPQILRAESNLRLAHKRLKSFLGLDLNEDIQVIEEPLEPSSLPLPGVNELTRVALVERPEIKAATFQESMRHKAVRIARGDYLPSLAAVAGYDWQAQSDDFTLNENISRAWTAGLRLTIPIFRGGRTRGEVTQAMVEHNKAILELQQTKDNITLEVEEAYDRMIQAGEALAIQATTIAQAEEGLRIANLRYESGLGILLEVLSAQAALTQARQAQAEAIFSYRAARAGITLATTIDLDV